MGKVMKRLMKQGARVANQARKRARPLGMRRAGRRGAGPSDLRRRQGESIGAHINRMKQRGSQMARKKSRPVLQRRGGLLNAQSRGADRARKGAGLMASVAGGKLGNIFGGKGASQGKRKGSPVSLGQRMFNKLRQKGRQMTPGQAKFEAMNEQRAGRSPSMGKRGAPLPPKPQLGDRSLARAQRERGMMRRPGMGKRGGMRMQPGGLGGIMNRLSSSGKRGMMANRRSRPPMGAMLRGPSQGKRFGRRRQMMQARQQMMQRPGMMQRRPGMGKRGGQPPQRGAMSSVPELGGGASQQQGNQQVAQRIPAPGLQPSTPMTPMQPPMTPMQPPMAPPMQPPMMARNPRRRFSLSNPYGA
tara:strand:+ start:5967 stop:7040 length:1074 start_codon:yes stop_codon:yes gene_type:complete